MTRRWLGALFAAVLVGVVLTAAPTSLRAQEGTPVEGQLINSAGYPLDIPGIGKARMRKVTVEGKRSDACRVVRESVVRLIQEGARKGSLALTPLAGSSRGVVITIELQTWFYVDSDGVKRPWCIDAGRGCEVEVEIPDPPAFMQP